MCTVSVSSGIQRKHERNPGTTVSNKEEGLGIKDAREKKKEKTHFFFRSLCTAPLLLAFLLPLLFVSVTGCTEYGLTVFTMAMIATVDLLCSLWWLHGERRRTKTMMVTTGACRD